MLPGRIILTALLTLLTVGYATAEEITPRQRLAAQLVGSAMRIADADTLSVSAIESGTLLIHEAVALDPENAEFWRLALKFAQLAEHSDLYAEALDNIIRLDPSDDVALLLRLTLAVEQQNSVEERVASYQRMVAREDLGPAVRSRLALDLALLQQRHGDSEAFAESLSKAVALDPSNRTAAAIAAGFFRMNVDDPYAEAELLFNLLLSDPTDVTTPIALAALLLEQGAYVGAERLYDLATRSQMAIRGTPTGNLLADHAISQWAAGDAAAALRTIRLRQELADEVRRAPEWETMDPLERAELHGVISPTLATVRAAIHVQREDEAALLWVNAALETYRTVLDRAAETQPPPDPTTIAGLHLEAAWVAAWLGGDVQQTEDLLRAAERLRPLTDAARARFEGWLALRRDDPAGAIEFLSPLAETDPAAGIGLAEAYLREGRRRDAARVLLATARLQPGSLIGIWAACELADLLGRRVPLSDETQRLEALIESMPRFVDRFPETSSILVALTVDPARSVVQAYEPLVVNVTITNVSPYPLAIDRDGPIRPPLILEFSSILTPDDLPPEGRLREVVVEIDRRLRLEPRESLIVPIDLRHYPVGWSLNRAAVQGTFLAAKVGLNSVFVPTGSIELGATGSIEPGLLGSEQWTGQIRVEGVRPSRDWLRATLRSLAEGDPASQLTTMALLANVVVDELPAYIAQLEEQRILLEATTTPGAERQLDRVSVLLMELKALLPDAADALEAAFATLDPVSQAWLIGVMPERRLLESIRAQALRSEDRLVQLSYLLFHIATPEDPMLEAAMRSDDPVLRRIAQVYVELFERLAEQADAPPTPTGSAGPG